MDPKLKKGLFDASRREPFGATLGINLVGLDTGYARVEMVYDPETMNNIYARAHGGAIFGLMDEAFQLSCQTHGTIAVALNVNITYVSSPETKTVLTAISEEVHKTRKTASYDIRVTDGEDRLVATCSALAYRTGKPVPFCE